MSYPKPRMIGRKIEFQALEPTTPVKPVRINASAASQGYAYEDAGAWVADGLGYALSGTERHMCAMIDQGLCTTTDLL